MSDIQQLALSLTLKLENYLRVLTKGVWVPVTETAERIGNQVRL